MIYVNNEFKSERNVNSVSDVKENSSSENHSENSFDIPEEDSLKDNNALHLEVGEHCKQNLWNQDEVSYHKVQQNTRSGVTHFTTLKKSRENGITRVYLPDEKKQRDWFPIL